MSVMSVMNMMTMAMAIAFRKLIVFKTIYDKYNSFNTHNELNPYIKSLINLPE